MSKIRDVKPTASFGEVRARARHNTSWRFFFFFLFSNIRLPADTVAVVFGRGLWLLYSYFIFIFFHRAHVSGTLIDSDSYGKGVTRAYVVNPRFSFALVTRPSLSSDTRVGPTPAGRPVRAAPVTESAVREFPRALPPPPAPVSYLRHLLLRRRGGSISA